ncbi:MAG: spermidine/putrescine ABC transporter substrate-binding protein [Candidatus Merdousia sp.]|nr:spermidine/putrescine ABC transporter substrate-binding protein [Candidatus Merdousia sp.]
MKKYITASAVAIATIACALISGCGPAKPALNVYMWSDYIDMDLVREFEKQNDCKVVIDIFDSNEFMYSKLKAGGTGYDVILPTTYMAKVMFDQNMLEKLDHSKLPNLKYINPNYLADLALDKKMEYSVPYMLGFTCVAYNKEKCGTLPETWDVFSNEKFAGKMTLLNDHRETIGAALFFLGKSMNDTNDADLAKAKEVLLKWKKNLAKFDNELYKVGIQSGEFLVVQGYSGDLFQVFAEAPNLTYMCPKEGISMSCDDWVIPATAKNKELAYKFINFLCDPKNAAKNMEFTCYSAPIPEARKYVSEENKNHPGMFLPDDLYKRGELIRDLGEDNAKFNALWDAVKGN